MFFLLGEQLPALSPYIFGPHEGDAIHILARAPADALHRPIAYLIIATIVYLLLRFFSWPLVWIISGTLWVMDQLFLVPEPPSEKIINGIIAFLGWGILALLPYFIYRWIDKKWGGKGIWKAMLILFLVNLIIFIFMAYQILVLHHIFGLHPTGQQGTSQNDQRNNCQPGNPNNGPDCPKTNVYLGVPCINNPNPKFSHDLTQADKIIKVTPPSLVAGKNQDRAFLWIDTNKTSKVPVYAPVDADLVSGVYKISKTIDTVDYDLHFQVSCEVWFYVNHVSAPIDEIKSRLPSQPETSTNNLTSFNPPIHFKAGELIGHTTGTFQAHNFDFAVFDLNHTNILTGQGGSSDSRFKNFICPFDLFPGSLKISYYKKLDPGLISESNCKSSF